jgi:hypothetical protein
MKEFVKFYDDVFSAYPVNKIGYHMPQFLVVDRLRFSTSGFGPG